VQLSGGRNSTMSSLDGRFKSTSTVYAMFCIERDTVARIVILVPVDAFHEHLYVCLVNHHLLDLGEFR
jgi:hypothetical protein